MSAAIVAAVIVGAVSIGTAVYSSEKQKDAAEKAANEQERLRLEEEERLKQIAMDTKPEGESATVEYGSGSDTGQDSFQDFLFKPTATTLGADSGAGISQTADTSTVTSLGF